MEFKTMLAEARKNQNMTQREMAIKLNVSDKTISKWETGVNFPDLTMLNQISKVIGISVSDLLSAEDLKEAKPVASDEEVVQTLIRHQGIAYILWLPVFIMFFFLDFFIPLKLLLMLVCVIMSVGFYVVSLMEFRTQIVTYRDKVKLNRIFVFWALLYLDLVLLGFSWVYFNFMFTYVLLIPLQAFPFFIRRWILKAGQMEYRKDRINTWLIRLCFFILIAGDLIFCTLLTGWFKFDLSPELFTLMNQVTSLTLISPLIFSYVIALRRDNAQVDVL